VTTGERVSTLEHLDALDQLLRDVQAELVPGAEIPDPPLPPLPPLPPEPPPAPPAPPVPEPPPPPPLPELVASLLASMRELLAGYERVLLPPAPAPPTQAPRARPEPPHATVSAGPFASIEAVRSFETAVSTLPGVRDVAVQAYEGTDRAIIDVRLDAAST